MVGHKAFSGSYAAGDVDFLLREIHVEPVDVAKKEAMIQSGEKHYSEMISEEMRPSREYLDIFMDAWGQGRARMAFEIVMLANRIRKMVRKGEIDPQISLCSLVRAGVPVGVLLHRELLRQGVDSAHFGISIIRDRGIDMVAMRHVMEVRGSDGIIFVDGWTGKGAITRELRHSWAKEAGLYPRLLVLADPAGLADITASHDDWLIPTGILGANISGLISRSILPAKGANGQFHGYVPVEHLRDMDLSAKFIDDIDAIAAGLKVEKIAHHHPSGDQMQEWRAAIAIKTVAKEFGITNMNRIKPGIAEATRAILRRKPERVLIADKKDANLAGLIQLCAERKVKIKVEPEMVFPYRAITIIGKAA